VEASCPEVRAARKNKVKSNLSFRNWLSKLALILLFSETLGATKAFMPESRENCIVRSIRLLVPDLSKGGSSRIKEGGDSLYRYK